jgi:divalent metal cation (Fe/Co/Zn/Cd) transporter
VRLKRWFRKSVLKHRTTTFAVMGVAFIVFGVGTLNLFMLLKRNVDLLTDYGWMALMDGGLAQLAELVVTGYLGLAAYVVFKACEHALVHHLARARYRTAREARL